jgi:predicted transcriptional regulator
LQQHLKTNQNKESMSKINNLWKRFHRIEADLKQLQKNSVAFQSKTQELLEVYEKIQQAEASLASWNTGLEA